MIGNLNFIFYTILNYLHFNIQQVLTLYALKAINALVLKAKQKFDL